MIEIYCDGSAVKDTLTNITVGSYAVLIVTANKMITYSDHVIDTTNNRMELMGAICALSRLPESTQGTLRTDSQYVVNGVNVWRKDWEKRNYRNKSNKIILNLDLWLQLYVLVDSHPSVQIQWVKGHADNAGNCHVDQLAEAETKKALRKLR